MSVSRAKQEIDSAEFSGWMAHAILRPDTSALFRLPAELAPVERVPREPTEDELLMKFRLMAAGLNRGKAD